MTLEAEPLADLLGQAAAADSLVRIDFRDRIAAHGEPAIEAMADWLVDPRLAAFAIRVLQQIGLDEKHRPAVIAMLRGMDREDLAPGLGGDVDAALTGLGAGRSRGTGRVRVPTLAERIRGLPGVDGRQYWVMRTSPGRRDLIWQEAAQGRLRQGWGWEDGQNLDVIDEALRHGLPLTEEQQIARRARRMRTTEPDGMRFGDLILTPNLPVWGVLSVFRLAGGYTWDRLELGIEDGFGHMLPVDLMTERIDRNSRRVSDALRSMLRPQTRLYRIDNVGGDVEQLVATTAADRRPSPG